VGESPKRIPPSLPGLILSQRSSPSRVRCAAPQAGAPLTAPGRSEPRIRQEGKGLSGSCSTYGHSSLQEKVSLARSSVKSLWATFSLYLPRRTNESGCYQSYVSNAGAKIQDTLTGTDASLAEESLGVSSKTRSLPNEPPALCVRTT